MEKKRSVGVIVLIVFALLLILRISPAYAIRYLMSLNEQFQKADCVVSAVLLDSHTVEVKNTIYEKNMVFTIFEFKVKKELKTGNYGALVNEIVYVTSQTKPEWFAGHEPERYAPKFDKNKEYILFLKETPSYYLFNFVQDFRESVEYTDKIVDEITQITSPDPK